MKSYNIVQYSIARIHGGGADQRGIYQTWQTKPDISVYGPFTVGFPNFQFESLKSEQTNCGCFC